MNTPSFRLFVFLWLLCSTGCGYAQFVVNEIHAAPAAGEPEWVELYNTFNQTRILRAGFINDRTSSCSLPDIRFPARGYVLLTRDTLALLESRPVPAGTVLIELKLPSLNNTTDIVVLRDADSVVIDSVYYNLKWGTRGISLERIDPLLPAVSQDNLATCEAPDSASAGAINSIVRLDKDVRVFTTKGSADGSGIQVHLGNNGRLPAQPGVVRLYLDDNGDGQPSDGELLAEKYLETLDTNERHTWTVFTDGLPPGYEKTITIADFPSDERRYNDTLRTTVYISPRPGAVQINEVMFSPLPGRAEYVELWNAGGDTVQLYGWVLHDRPTSDGADTLRITGDLFLPPGGYVVLTWDSTFFEQFPELHTSGRVYFRKFSLNLNADGDDVVLRDPNNVLIDSISYLPSWHGLPPSSAGGHSLEKLNPRLPSARGDSWSTCGDATGGTPARENSIAVPLPNDGTFAGTPNPFSRSRNEVCLLSYHLPYRLARLSITVFDASGVPVRTMLSASFTSGEGFASWNGNNDDGFPMPPGPYVVLLEAVDLATAAVFTDKLLVVIAP